MKFATGGVPVRIAAKVLGMAPETVRQRMADGTLDIGVCFIPVRRGRGRGRKNRAFYISPKKLYELTGYIWGGEEDEGEETDKETDVFMP